MLGLVGDMQKHRFTILKSLTLLRQLALDPGLVDDTHDGLARAKLDGLLDDLTQVIAEGHRALVFSQFTRYLRRVRARLDEAGIGYATSTAAPASVTRPSSGSRTATRRCSSSASRRAGSG